MKPLKLTVIPQEKRKAEFAIDEPYKEPVKRIIPHFPDHPNLKDEKPFGTLKTWLKKLQKKGED